MPVCPLDSFPLIFTLIGTSLVMCSNMKMPEDMNMYIYCSVGIIISCTCLFQILIPKKNENTLILLNQISGFMDFLLTADTLKIKSLVAENPQYFYNILPYAYVFDTDCMWFEKFESVIKRSPDWYIGNFTWDSFLNLTNSLYDSCLQKKIRTGALK